jgi:serine O-acetyltransferase
MTPEIHEAIHARKDLISRVTAELCEPESYKIMVHDSHHDVPMPSVSTLAEIVESLKSLIFPGFFGSSELTLEALPYFTGSTLVEIHRRLSDQIQRGLCFDGCQVCSGDCDSRSQKIAEAFIEGLPEIRRLLSTDVIAAYNGDPAAKSYGESIFCYPSIRALTNHRIAHSLHKLGVPIIPRIISELAHSETGIDIHPGATIGEYFFMDHGTGIVIGETAIIGSNVRVYQGVTLGAKSFPKDDEGNPLKGLARHPIVEDDCIIYSGATILGRVTIGKGSVIGGNVWLTHDLEPGSHVMQGRAELSAFLNGDGI